MKREIRVRPLASDGRIATYGTIDEAIAALKRAEGKGSIRYVVIQSPAQHVFSNRRAEARESLEVLIHRYGRRCLACETNKHLLVDHIVPLTRKGDSDIENLQVLCRKCNFAKGLQVIDYRPFPFDSLGICCSDCETFTWNISRFYYGAGGAFHYRCLACWDMEVHGKPEIW